MADSKLAQLRWYIQHQYPIFPCTWINGNVCSCGKENCSSKGKHPLVEGGFYAATIDMVKIENWHKRWPEANWGMRTGSIEDGGAGILVVDIDPRHKGDETWNLLREENGGLIETVTVHTGGGGIHYWFSYPQGFQISSKAGSLGIGVDCKANGGYVLIPPSRTELPYTFDLDPRENHIQILPEWILDRLDEQRSSVKLGGIEKKADIIPVGTRHNSLVELAVGLRTKGFSGDEIKTSLEMMRDRRFEQVDEDTQSEIDSVVQWVEKIPQSYSQSDMGNAQRFVDQQKENVRFCYQLGCWFVWDGKRWAKSENGEIIILAHEVVKSIYAEVSNCTGDDKRRSLAKHALRSEGRRDVENMLECAKPYLFVGIDQLDQHPMLFNCRNGIVDLSNGDLIEHDRKYLLTKMADVDYDQNAKCPAFENFLKIITGGDQDLEFFLQRSVGYSLTGRTDEHCLFFLYGTGKNGKSTFVETMRRLMGDYSQRTDIEAIMQTFGGRGGGASPYIAALKGARFVVGSEMPEGRRLNESLVKDLTGGDAIVARNLYSPPFTFYPTYKLWLYGNYKPKVVGTDEGFWRRIRIIPFKVTIPKEIQRPMSEVMAEFEKELSGILTWAVYGCLLWQTNGLQMPDAVKEATISYRGEQDLVQQFIEECCEMQMAFSVNKKDLFNAWRTWCENAGEEAAKSKSKRWLTQQFTSRGYELGGNGNTLLVGIHLKEEKCGN